MLPPGTYPDSIYVTPELSVTSIVRMMDEKGLVFPVAAKPDSGLMGFMFRKIETVEHLRQYHAAMAVDYIIQEYIRLPIEVSVFYYRYPGHEKGHITGFVRKELLEVVGDGRKTLFELMTDHPRVQFRLEEMKGKHASRLHEVIPQGQQYCLSYALNLSRGGKLVSLEHEKDERLLNVFDRLSHASGFYYGRYDIRCQSVEDLKEGKNFSILEFNGCGAEPHHVYGNGNTLMKACFILVQHWNIMYRIARQHYRNGVPYWEHKKARTFYKQVNTHMRKLKALDREFEFDGIVPERFHEMTGPLVPSPMAPLKEY